MPKNIAVGIDIGGTHIKSALVQENGHILSKKKIHTKKQDDSKEFIKSLIDLINHYKNETTGDYDLIGVGIGAPGNVNRESGLVEGAYNVPPLQNVQLIKELKPIINIPVYVDNDATNATKGEFLFGSGKGYDHLIGITIGTGIGGGIILNRHVFHGITNYAGEIGHMIIIKDGMMCSCGNRGCLEAYASTTAMVDHARQLIKRDHKSLLQSYNPSEINGELICKLANEGDEVSITVIQTIGYYLGLAIANIVNLLNIPIIAVGGGISDGAPNLFNVIESSANEHVLPKLRGTFQVVKAQLGNDAGVIGSASTVFMEGESAY